jgi:hypothetical protein
MDTMRYKQIHVSALVDVLARVLGDHQYNC